MKNINVFVSAGEVSGDKHGAEVIDFLKKQISEDIKLQVWGMGGLKLKEQSIELIQDSTDLGVIGAIDVIKRLPFFIGLKKKLIDEIKRRKPDIALLIDYPGLNLQLAKEIKKHVPFCKVIFYVAPQVWAWNPKRVFKLPYLVDRLFPILPFEEDLHKKYGTSAKFVGNPTAWNISQLDPNFDALGYKKSLGFDADKPLIGIYPGSRNREIDYMLPIFLKAAQMLKSVKPEVQFVLVQSNSIKKEKINKSLKAHKISEDLLKVVDYENNLSVLRTVDVAWLKSGTVTLEAACCETPLILGYKEFPLFWKVYLMLRQIDKIGLPNIIASKNRGENASKNICPELLQEHCTPTNWAGITERWLNDPEELEAIKQSLRENVKTPLHSEHNPAEYIAHEILMIYQIHRTSRDNVAHMKEQAHKNSQQTNKEISANPIRKSEQRQ